MGEKFVSEAIVIGAGPAGLGTALGLAREGIDVVVLEKQSRLGSERRGETIRFHAEMDDLLGHGFLEKQAIRKISRRTYFSHTGKQSVDRTISNPNLIISWPDFIQAMAGVVTASGARIWPSSCVLDFIKEDGRVQGVRAMVNGFVEEDLKAHAVFSCGGWDDPASRQLLHDRSKIDLPVSKKLVRGYTGPRDRLEYHFHISEDSLAVGTIFPRGGTEAEIILMSLPKGGKTVRLSFDEFCGNHPLFKERLEGTGSFYTLNSMVPMGGMIFPFCQRPGLVMAGDALGHVQARGGSGIRSSFLIGYTAGRLGAQAIRSGLWSRETSELFEKNMAKSHHVRSLKLHNLVFSELRSMIFSRLQGPEDMDRQWRFLKHALR